MPSRLNSLERPWTLQNLLPDRSFRSRSLPPLYVAFGQTQPQFRASLSAFPAAPIPVTIRIHADPPAGPGLNRFKRQRIAVADTTKIEDRQERKKVKRAARKKAAPKAKRTTPRGSNKKKLKKLVRGVSKR
jgi:hypothetical protein